MRVDMAYSKDFKFSWGICVHNGINWKLQNQCILRFYLTQIVPLGGFQPRGLRGHSKRFGGFNENTETAFWV